MAQEIWLPIIDQIKCTGCGACITACPTATLALSGSVAVVAKPQACTYCGICEMICPTEAISLPYELTLGTNQ